MQMHRFTGLQVCRFASLWMPDIENSMYLTPRSNSTFTIHKQTLYSLRCIVNDCMIAWLLTEMSGADSRRYEWASWTQRIAHGVLCVVCCAECGVAILASADPSALSYSSSAVCSPCHFIHTFLCFILHSFKYILLFKSQLLNFLSVPQNVKILNKTLLQETLVISFISEPFTFPKSYLYLPLEIRFILCKFSLIRNKLKLWSE